MNPSATSPIWAGAHVALIPSGTIWHHLAPSGTIIAPAGQQIVHAVLCTTVHYQVRATPSPPTHPLVHTYRAPRLSASATTSHAPHSTASTPPCQPTHCVWLQCPCGHRPRPPTQPCSPLPSHVTLSSSLTHLCTKMIQCWGLCREGILECLLALLGLAQGVEHGCLLDSQAIIHDLHRGVGGRFRTLAFGNECACMPQRKNEKKISFNLSTPGT